MRTVKRTIRSVVHSAAFALMVAAMAWGAPARAETVNVKYRGVVDLAPFACENITRSSFINRACYDSKNTYMLIERNRPI
ncbi:hypothetical protein SAMN05444161_5288 [Rhizobiales bacterium GAS191]|nr:hypothetical protein SAMN05444161_5288 [Rhizobiales bacterium GAS191]